MPGNVAPHAGAWIETGRTFSLFRGTSVAPHAGAWIETFDHLTSFKSLRGRAPRGRVD